MLLLQRMFTGLSSAYMFVTFCSHIPLKYSGTGIEYYIYTTTAISNMINGYLIWKCQTKLPSLTLSIDWDCYLEHFIVRRPAGIYGGTKKIFVKPQNFK